MSEQDKKIKLEWLDNLILDIEKLLYNKSKCGTTLVLNMYNGIEDTDKSRPSKTYDGLLLVELEKEIGKLENMCELDSLCKNSVSCSRIDYAYNLGVLLAKIKQEIKGED